MLEIGQASPTFSIPFLCYLRPSLFIGKCYVVRDKALGLGSNNGFFRTVGEIIQSARISKGISSLSVFVVDPSLSTTHCKPCSVSTTVGSPITGKAIYFSVRMNE